MQVTQSCALAFSYYSNFEALRLRLRLLFPFRILLTREIRLDRGFGFVLVCPPAAACAAPFMPILTDLTTCIFGWHCAPRCRGGMSYTLSFIEPLLDSISGILLLIFSSRVSSASSDKSFLTLSSMVNSFGSRYFSKTLTLRSFPA